MSCICGFGQRLQATKRDRLSQKSVRCLRTEAFPPALVAIFHISGGEGGSINIRPGRHVSSQCPKQKHFPRY